MFVQAFEQISKKLSKSAKKVEGYKILEKKILDSPVLKSHFEVYNDLKENTNTIANTSQFKNFFLTLTEKVNKIDIKEVNKEVKALLEFFNINPSSIKETIMDKAMILNEVAVRKVVINEKKSMLSETYKHIIKEENEFELRKEFQIINYISESISNGKRKLFLKESLRSLLEERYKDYKSCVKKLYKLRVLADELITEAIDDESEIKSEHGGGKKTTMKDLSYIKSIDIIVPEMYKKPEKIILSFYIPVYPIGATMSASTTSAIRIREKLNRIERAFINSAIYAKGKTNLFNPVGTIWQVSLKMQSKPGSKQNAGVDIYLNTNIENEGTNTWEMFKQGATEILKDLNDMLPDLLGDMASVLTPENQKSSLTAVKGLSKSEKAELAHRNGDVDRDLIKKKIGGENYDDSETRVDDFADMF